MATSCERSFSASTPSTRKISSPDTESASATSWRRLSGIAASISRRITEPAAAALQRALEEAHQVLGLFLDLDVRVADDAEGALPSTA